MHTKIFLKQNQGIDPVSNNEKPLVLNYKTEITKQGERKKKGRDNLEMISGVW